MEATGVTSILNAIQASTLCLFFDGECIIKGKEGRMDLGRVDMGQRVMTVIFR